MRAICTWQPSLPKTRLPGGLCKESVCMLLLHANRMVPSSCQVAAKSGIDRWNAGRSVPFCQVNNLEPGPHSSSFLLHPPIGAVHDASREAIDVVAQWVDAATGVVVTHHVFNIADRWFRDLYFNVNIGFFTVLAWQDQDAIRNVLTLLPFLPLFLLCLDGSFADPLHVLQLFLYLHMY